MVQLIKNNEIVSLESTRTISEGQLALIKEHAEEVENACKDLGIRHFFHKTEDGIIISKVSTTAPDKCNPIEITNELEEKHTELLRCVDKFALEELAKSEDEDEEEEEEFFAIHKTEKGYEAFGNMNPVKVIAMLQASIIFKAIQDANSEQPE